MGHLFKELLGRFEAETVGVDLVFGETVDSEVELTQLVHEGLKEVPGDNGMEVDLIELMGEDRVIVFPAFLDAVHKILDGVRVLKPIEPGAVDELIIQGLGGHVVFNFKLLFDDVEFGEAVRELGPLIDLVEVVVVETVDVEGLCLGGLLILDGLLQLVQQVLDQLFALAWQLVADQFLLNPCG